jgi:hypothetical protein
MKKSYVEHVSTDVKVEGTTATLQITMSVANVDEATAKRFKDRRNQQALERALMSVVGKE